MAGFAATIVSLSIWLEIIAESPCFHQK